MVVKNSRSRHRASIAQRRAAFRKPNAEIRSNERNVGETMLLPIAILVLTLSPVLIPALVTAFHLAARLRNSNEFVTVLRRPMAALATEGY
jgi:hypothetical protein